MPIIETKALCKSFTTYHKEEGLVGSLKNLFHREYLQNLAVDHVDLSLEEGELVGFLGPNGAGKTTTLKLLTGLIYPSSGYASVMGYTPWERKNDFRRQYSLVMGQKNQLWWDLPAVETFYLNREIYQIPDSRFKATLGELTELLGVEQVLKTQVRRLSLGERMKLELIAALLHQPRVLFLDEPTIGLDVVSQKKIRDFLKYYNQQNRTTILLTSHYMDDIQALCKRVVIINHGRKIYDGSLDKIVREFSEEKELTVTFAEPVTEPQMTAIAPVKEFDPVKVTFRVKRTELVGVLTLLLQRYRVADLNTSEIAIEEIIAQIFTESNNEVSS
jgi:ABC-2 type transport system ATP-binding protein